MSEYPSAHNRPAQLARTTVRLDLRLFTLAFFCALWLLLHGWASAQAPQVAEAAAAEPSVEPDAPGSAYSRSVDAALIEYERGNFEEAREHLRSAHESYPNARTFRGLGKAEFELRNYGESVKMLEAALASPIKPLDQPLRAEVSAILARARAYVGEVHVNVEPGSAIVSVDGVPMASGPDAALALVVGDHVLEFRASGHLSERRAIRVKGGERLTVNVVLPAPSERDSHSASVPTTYPGEDRADTSVRRRRWILGSLGVVIVGSIVAGVLVATRAGEGRAGEVSGGTTGVVIENP